MKKITLVAALALLFTHCKKQEEITPEAIEPEATYSTFGAEITKDGAMDIAEMTQKFKNMNEGDTLAVKFKSTILNVCQKKGCWMQMDLEGDKEALVRFTDYGFFVPLDASEQESIVEGRAFLKIRTVDDLKHEAKDAGRTPEEIEAITEPEVTYYIQADGVLIKDKEVAEATTTPKAE